MQIKISVIGTFPVVILTNEERTISINTIPLAFIDANTLKFIDFTVGNIYWVFIWLLWGLLWLTGFIELSANKPIVKIISSTVRFLPSLHFAS